MRTAPRRRAIYRDYKGKSYFFCSSGVPGRFRQGPGAVPEIRHPAQGAMPPAGSRDAAAKHTPHGSAAVPRPRGAKDRACSARWHDDARQPKPLRCLRCLPPPPKLNLKWGGWRFPPPLTPGMGSQLPALPGQEGMPMSMPQEAAPMSGVQTGETATPASVTKTPRIKAKSPRHRLPGTAPQVGQQEASPVPGPKAGEMLPSATDDPEVKR